MEDGTIVLVGATTENPSFELNGALLSRAQVLVLRRLDDDDLETLLERAEEYLRPRAAADRLTRAPACAPWPMATGAICSISPKNWPT